MPEPSELSPDELYAAYAMNQAMERYTVPPHQFFRLDNGGTAFIASSRQLAALIIREGTDLTYEEIAGIIGYKRSAKGAVDSMRARLGSDEAVEAEIARVMGDVEPNA